MNKRMMESLEKKLSKSVGYRADLQMADARRISKSDAHFMLAYTGDIPSTDDIANFFIRTFSAKVTPHIGTAKVLRNEKVVTVVASLLNVSRTFADHGKMTPIVTGSIYLDVPLQEVWEVKERDGEKVLIRKVKDDIMAMVQARRLAMQDQSKSHQTFASVATTTSSLLRLLALLEKGDVVRIFHEGRLIDGCEVMAIGQDEVKVKVGDKSVTIPRQAVVEVTVQSKSRKDTEKKALEKYFEQAYGDPDYAKELVKKS